MSVFLGTSIKVKSAPWSWSGKTGSAWDLDWEALWSKLCKRMLSFPAWLEMSHGAPALPQTLPLFQSEILLQWPGPWTLLVLFPHLHPVLHWLPRGLCDIYHAVKTQKDTYLWSPFLHGKINLKKHRTRWDPSVASLEPCPKDTQPGSQLTEPRSCCLAPVAGPLTSSWKVPSSSLKQLGVYIHAPLWLDVWVNLPQPPRSRPLLPCENAVYHFHSAPLSLLIGVSAILLDL